jgi:hypothetical protein
MYQIDLKRRPRTTYWLLVMERINKKTGKSLKNAAYIREVAHGCKWNKEVMEALPDALAWATKKTGVEVA